MKFYCYRNYGTLGHENEYQYSVYHYTVYDKVIIDIPDEAVLSMHENYFPVLKRCENGSYWTIMNVLNEKTHQERWFKFNGYVIRMKVATTEDEFDAWNKGFSKLEWR